MTTGSWAALAFAWSVLFALPNLLWAAGFDSGSETIAADPDAALGWGAEPWALALAGIAKIAIGVVALAAASRDEGWLRRVVLVIGAGLLIYGLGNVVQHGLFVGGILEVPESLGGYASRWHLLLWAPLWLLGGFLFLMTGWRSGRDRVEWRQESVKEETTT